MTLQFPDCDDEDAISVSCLDIYYTVKFKKTKVLDDKDDKIAPLLLDNLDDNISGWLSLFSELCPTTRFLSLSLTLSLSLSLSLSLHSFPYFVVYFDIMLHVQLQEK